MAFENRSIAVATNPLPNSSLPFVRNSSASMRGVGVGLGVGVDVLAGSGDGVAVGVGTGVFVAVGTGSSRIIGVGEGTTMGVTVGLVSCNTATVALILDWMVASTSREGVELHPTPTTSEAIATAVKAILIAVFVLTPVSPNQATFIEPVKRGHPLIYTLHRPRSKTLYAYAL